MHGACVGALDYVCVCVYVQAPDMIAAYSRRLHMGCTYIHICNQCEWVVGKLSTNAATVAT